MQRFDYRPQLDGLRALCIIFTLIAHTPNNHGLNGSVGVDIFFALSGYLITSLLLIEKANTGHVSLGSFYIRRVFRIVPLYVLTIALYYAGAWVAFKSSGDTRGLTGWSDALPWLVTFNSEWRPDSAGSTFWHAWTLGIEEKYYLAWPLLFVSFAGGRRLYWLLLAMPVLLLLGEYNSRGYIGILAGSLGALWLATGRGRAFVDRTSTHLWAALMMLGITISTAFGTRFNVLISGAAVFFIACLLTKPKDVYQRVLSSRALVKIGSLTYVIYLIHRLVGNVVEQVAGKLHLEVPFFAHLVLTLAGSIAGGLIVQWLVETPMIRVGKRLAARWDERQLKVASAEA